jgi:signal-transduction protein with cAMP-binding, CBS, and nucleotidyltransferase domain
MKTRDLFDNKASPQGRTNALLNNAKVPFLSNIPEPDLRHLMGKAKILRYAKRGAIQPEMVNKESIIIIFMGNFWVGNRNERTGLIPKIEVEEPHSGFAKIALVTNEIRSNAVVNLEKTVFAHILKSDFTDWLVNHPDVDFTLLSVA